MKIYGVISEEVYPLFEYNKPHLDALGIPYHFEAVNLGKAGPNHIKTYKYGLCLYKRCKYYGRVLDESPEGSIVLFTDLDVVPLGDYMSLMPYLDNVDLCFMREYKIRSNSVNCGFILLRNSSPVRELFRSWLSRCEDVFRKKNYVFDQEVMQKLLRDIGFSYKTFPHAVVSRAARKVYKKTIAFHAINVGMELQNKIDAMSVALTKSNKYKR